MTTTDIPARTPSPTEVAAAAETTSKPVTSSDTPSSPGGADRGADRDRAADPTILTQTSEAEQAIHVTDEQPSHPQSRDTIDERVSPEVESLKAMFPDFDITILQSVLQSVDGDQERAADVLLGMSDPSYISQQHTTRSQSDLDEEFARSLVLEEQRQQANWHPDQPYPYPQDPRTGANVPYQPRVHQGHHGYQQQWGSPPPQAEGGRDTMTGVQEQFTKIAETGKKTFSSLMSKVKAKMQDYDQGNNQSGSSQQSQQTSWGPGTPSGVSPPQNEYSQPLQRGARSPPLAEAVQGYDANPPSAAGTGLSSGPAVSATPSPIPAPAERIPARPPSAGNVDPSKIGMLPKRPVSLLDTTGSQPQAQSNAMAHRDSADDELDYVENPFEEGRK
ncbi:hypothetical protein A7U60_g5478 [Sanghuangporus baumii]|uniref:CUE domain-containing protein n=1 Tax=Sanghuangporus baumii TaxID=108892 RepID=A0A9Q5HWN3_SANBA|nr:hypothetical protein A7U60_g5478 [Sanghuangporus baumii]